MTNYLLVTLKVFILKVSQKNFSLSNFTHNLKNVFLRSYMVKFQYINRKIYCCSADLILTTVKNTDVSRWSIWKIIIISYFPKFALCHFMYSCSFVSFIRNLAMDLIRGKMEHIFVSSPDNYFYIFASRSSDIYSSIFLLSKPVNKLRRLISFI